MGDLTLFNIITLGFPPKRLHFLFWVYLATEVIGMALEKMESLPSEAAFHLAHLLDHKPRLACLVERREMRRFAPRPRFPGFDGPTLPEALGRGCSGSLALLLAV